MIIYKVTNLINNKIYIGLTKQEIQRRKKQHELHSLKKPLMVLHYAIKKYGKENFKWEILKECNDFKELNYYERFFIKQYNSTNKDIGYNRTTGGENPIMSATTRKKMSNSQIKRYRNPIVKKQWSELMKDVYKKNPISEETKRKIGISNSISLKGKKQTKKTIKKRMVSFRKFWNNVSEEWKKNRSKKIWETRLKNKERILNERKGINL